MPKARVNFAGLTAYPRKDEDGNIILWSCSSPVRDDENHRTLDVVCNSEDDVQTLRGVGVVELSELDTYTDTYEDKEGEEQESLNCTFGSVLARGDW